MLVTIVRIFDSVVFMFAAGLAMAMALTLKTALYRKFFLFSFASLCFGTVTGNIIGIADHRPWHWWSSTFLFVSALLSVITVGVAWHDRKKNEEEID
jgi:hypothetical membrane protein